jgi:hypothetical protein
MGFRRFGYSLICVLPRLALGCCAHPEGHKDLLAFLRDGRTTKDEVETRIGPASVRGDGRLWTYRVGEAAESFYLSANRSLWSDARQTSPFVSAASSGGKAPIGAVSAIMI